MHSPIPHYVTSLPCFFWLKLKLLMAGCQLINDNGCPLPFPFSLCKLNCNLKLWLHICAILLGCASNFGWLISYLRQWSLVQVLEVMGLLGYSCLSKRINQFSGKLLIWYVFHSGPLLPFNITSVFFFCLTQLGREDLNPSSLLWEDATEPQNFWLILG